MIDLIQQIVTLFLRPGELLVALGQTHPGLTAVLTSFVIWLVVFMILRRLLIRLLFAGRHPYY